jgi:hypothetical protein
VRLARADHGFAMGTGTFIAIENAHVTWSKGISPELSAPVFCPWPAGTPIVPSVTH